MSSCTPGKAISDLASIPTLFITANVGSIFEDPQNLLKIWVREFLSTVKQVQPKFLALHCQEVGGKNYEECMRHVEDFVRMLMASEELHEFGKVRVYLDEDFTCTERFTALGNLYFVHNALKHIQIWDYKEHKFFPLEGKEVHSGNIERVTTKDKSKFPQEEGKWSRKGFMRTRWNVLGAVFELINIHLFHDASNFVAMESFPSVYSKSRQNALAYTLRRISSDECGKVPFFIFGDFNFRLDTKDLTLKLTNSAIPVLVKSAKNGEVEKVLYKDRANESRVVLTVEKKVFDLNGHEEFFFNSAKWLQEFDKELHMFHDELFEFDKEFPPSYPFQEDIVNGSLYMRTRCPAWCDRVLLCKTARSLIDMKTDSNSFPVHYQLLGVDVAMGDHKPVMLFFRLLPQTGMLPPFIYKLQALDMCALQSHHPSARAVSNSPVLYSSDASFVANKTVSSASCVLDSRNTQSALVDVKDDIYLSSLWLPTQLPPHQPSSEEWHSHLPSDSQSLCFRC